MKNILNKLRKYKYVITANKAVITGFTGVGGELHIPDTLGNHPVVSIGERAFFGNKRIKKVVIPASVTTLKKEAFSHCENLSEIIMNDGLSVISSYCFAGCRSLKTVSLPDSLSTIFRAAFLDCVALQEIEIPEGVTVLNAEAFRGCSGLKSIGLPNDLGKICSSTFRDCSSLQEFYHYCKRIVSSVMVTDRDLKEKEFPPQIQYIGSHAFENCARLERVRIPHRVKILSTGTFQNCTSLTEAHMHNSLEEIKDRVFLGCDNLAKIKLPIGLQRIGNNVFSRSTSIICERGSYSSKYALQNRLPCHTVVEAPPLLASHMIPSKSECFSFDEHRPFYSEQDLRECIEKYEIRSPSYETKHRPSMAIGDSIASSRFDFVDGTYEKKTRSSENRAVIMMVGDLMCHLRQQRASFDAGKYSFDTSLMFVKDIFNVSDFAIANLETMVSPTAPFTMELFHVNNVPHLNAPESYLGAIRNASIDAVVNAQNHVYDTGVQGLFETLDMQNKYQLMHTGAYASREDKRYLMLEINGIRIAFLAYLDITRQQMKRANFSRTGKEILFNVFGTDSSGVKQVINDVDSAKKEGAEFIFAFCHWGREYTNSLTERQIDLCKQVANAGVDYIFGSHSHCVQPYDVITTDDKREVPVFYSAGSFLSDIRANPPITKDTLIGEVVLKRDTAGRVVLEGDGYYPCRVLGYDDPEIRFVVVPTAFRFKGDLKKNEELMEAEERIQNVIGTRTAKRIPQKELLITGKTFEAYINDSDEDSNVEAGLLDYRKANPTQRFNIESIAELLGAGLSRGNSNTRLERVTFEAKEADSASIFIGLYWGTRRIDTNDHLEKAYSFGCRNFITEIDFKKEGINVIKVNNGNSALQQIAHYHRKKHEVPLIAITGSVGKTTTKEMIYCILSQQFNTLKSFANYNTDQGVCKTLLDLQKEHEIAVVEMAAYGKNTMLKRIEIAEPSVAIVTSIGFSHIEHYKDQEELFETKMEIASGLKQDDLLIINGDDEFLKRLKARNNQYRMLTYGFDESNDLVCRNYTASDSSITFYLESETVSGEFTINTPAKHNIYNAMAAIATGLHYGIPVDVIQEGLKGYKHTKSRLAIKQTSNYKIIDDTYNASSMSMISALDVLCSVSGGRRRVAILGDILELGTYAEQQHRLVGSNVKKRTDLLVTIGENARYIYEEALEDGFDNENCFHFATIDEFCAVCKDMVKKNDVILVKASNGMKFIEIVSLLTKS